MIRTIYGGLGDGKSLFGAGLILDLLYNENFIVVTNLAMKPQQCQEFLVRKDPNRDYDLPHRLRLMTEEETAHFWRKRALRPEDTDASKVPFMERVYFIIDEAHEFFDNRHYKDFSDEARNYLAQCRKLGDEVIFITHKPSELDIKIRNRCQEFIKVRNEKRIRFSFIRGRNRFTTKTAYKDPGDSDRVTYAMVDHFKLDIDGVANCYDTAAGVGIQGKHADKHDKPKGIPMEVVLPFVILAMCAVAALPWLVGQFVKHYAAERMNFAKAQITGKPKVPVLFGNPPPQSNTTEPAPVVIHQPGMSQSQAPFPNAVELQKPVTLPSATGYLLGQGHVLVTLTNGSILRDAQVREVLDDRVVTTDGTILPILPRPVVPGPTPPPPPPDDPFTHGLVGSPNTGENGGSKSPSQPVEATPRAVRPQSTIALTPRLTPATSAVPDVAP